MIVVSSILLTLLTAYPWLSIQEGPLLNPKNPYSELFSISNGGYWPISDLDVDCLIDAEGRNLKVFGNHMQFVHFASYLTHSSTATVPCFKTIELLAITKADLTVVVEYSFYPITFRNLRRHQSFRLHAVKAPDGLLHWTFVS